ncbi:hypothetical protein C0995_000861 [Termitomyces sp. Mi166|nr:hypothetical protein C0995_000861 [Termitomyces sp. Mi166\
MHSDRRSSSDETRPLLEEVPPSYCATNDVDNAASEPPPASEDHAMTRFSRADTMWILAGLWSGVLLGALDGTVVATLLTPIGRLADILGRKGAMLVALTLFGSGTICCGIAPSMQALIAARAVAGMGGGGLYGLGAGLGGPLGGWVNDTFGWRAAFYMQVHFISETYYFLNDLPLYQAPLLLFSIIVVAIKVNIPLPLAVRQQSLSEKLRRLDVLGSATLAATVGCLLLGFSIKTAEELPWSHPLIYGLLIASFALGFLFVHVEKHWAPYPVMPLRLMTQRTPIAVSISNLLTIVPQLYNVPLIAISFGSVLAGWIMRRTGKLYSLTLASCGLTILASALVVMWDEKSSTWHLYLDLVPQGFGMASFITSTLIVGIPTL